MILVLFDCDGTLVDSQRMIVASMTAAFKAHNLAPPSRERTLSIVGLSLDRALPALTQDLADPPISSLIAHYKAAFLRHRSDPNLVEPMFSGARETVEALAARDDILLGIVTGKSRRGVDAVLGHHGLLDRFKTIQTADDAPSHPDPAMVLQAVSAVGAEPSRTCVIGDTSFDMTMARNAGARAIGVSWGYHPVSSLLAAGADDIAGDFAAVLRAVNGLLDPEAAP